MCFGRFQTALKTHVFCQISKSTKIHVFLTQRADFVRSGGRARQEATRPASWPAGWQALPYIKLSLVQPTGCPAGLPAVGRSINFVWSGGGLF